MFEMHIHAELLPERKALGGLTLGDIAQDVDLDQDTDVDVDNSSCFGNVDVTAFNNASINQSAG